MTHSQVPPIISPVQSPEIGPRIEGESGEGEDFQDEGAAASEERHWTVTAEAAGLRLDRFLAQQVADFSRSYLQQLIDEGLLRRNGVPCGKAAVRLKTGDALELTLRATAQSQAFVAQDIALEVVYEDAHLAVINKPAGLVVHPAPGNWSGTLLNALLHRYAEAATLPRAGIVHRLDKDTSGLMVVARDRITMDRLIRLIADREVHREYWALGTGRWSGPAQRTVTAGIGRDPRNRLRMAAVDLERQAGKPARTDFRLVGNSMDSAEAACWVHCTLHTGRTHQIRVHMQTLRHPLVSDAVYGGAVALGMQRQALHAFRLSFRHPQTGAPLQYEALPPADMQAAIAAMGLDLPRE